MAVDSLQALLEQAFPDATELRIEDRTGGGDHFQVVVATPRFAQLSLIDQHRLVNEALAEPLRDGTIHELRMKNERKRMTELSERIEDLIQSEPVTLFMKGTPEFVMCGNSERALRALREAGAPVTAVDVLPDPAIRQELSAVSGWPTVPQVFVKGELIGGADITEELAASGELTSVLEKKLGLDYRASAAERTVSLLTPA